jgi:hypothetical protein
MKLEKIHSREYTAAEAMRVEKIQELMEIINEHRYVADKEAQDIFTDKIKSDPIIMTCLINKYIMSLESYDKFIGILKELVNNILSKLEISKGGLH